jgi:hypothetical protein
MPSILCSFYTYALILIMKIELTPIALISVLLMGVLESLIIGFAIMSLAEDKIKGLTLAKGLGGFLVFAFADLIPVTLIKVIAYGVPYYWIGQVVLSGTAFNMIMGILVHGVFLGFVILRLRRMVY